MKPIRIPIAVAGLVALGACADQSPVTVNAPDAAPLLAAQSGGIEGSYIVVLNDGADPRSVAAVAGVSPRYVYTATLNGFSASLNAGQLNALRHNPSVDYVEQDQVVRATQTSVPWNLDRIDQRSLPLNGAYTPIGTPGTGVRAYVIDTGIYTAHTQFGGRASNVYDATGGNGADCNGHGTHVAGIIGATSYGVANRVTLHGVRVLNCTGSGTSAGVIAGVDWVRVNRVNPAVANMSVGGGFSTALNTAVNNLANSGVFVSVGAGADNASACNVSPASAASAMTVAASTSTDAKASYTNYGSCVDIYAPGSSIISTWHTSTTATNTISGTSMAAPHAAGVAARYKATYGNAATATIDTWIKNRATANVITGNPTGTPNRLLYVGL
ncbi:MAG TPA: S8 family peptidase [Longimicrobium sp.]|jgi:subtilisin family serine protease|uniref:S8 family peptidase n=1 Tax=Longimicrobium sp. TaxID=2029185 RepID=UPI002ED8DC28